MSFFVVEQISEGVYDPRDLKRFNEIDDYTLTFIQHGQFGTSLNRDRVLHVFDAAMSWRKRHNVYGKKFRLMQNIRNEIFLVIRYFCQ